MFESQIVCRAFLVLGLLGAGAEAGDSSPPPTAAPEATALERLTRELEREYPDRESVVVHFMDIAARLEVFAQEEVVPPGASSEAGKARLLQAEILALGGSSGAADARRVLAELASRAPLEEDRAKALYLLGEQYFFRGRFLPQAGAASSQGGRQGAALEYWGLLERRHPQSPWTLAIERSMRYLRLLERASLPEFRETFETSLTGGATQTREFTLEDLRGRLVILDFWKGGVATRNSFQSTLLRDLRALPDRVLEAQDRVVILGINLDEGRADFERARQAWDIGWPQHHDGLGFETPLAKLLGIPTEPHRLIVDPSGKVVFAGADADASRRVLWAELTRLESPAPVTPPSDATPPAPGVSPPSPPPESGR